MVCKQGESTVTKCYHTALSFPSVKRRKVEADFCGGDITSHGGIPFLSQVDQQLGLNRAAARALTDPRRQASCDHSSLARLQQRIYALALGYEDLNDHQELRHDLALQTAASRVENLASPNRIRLVLLKVGAVMIRNTRRIRLLMSRSYPHQDLFRTVAWRLDSS